MKDHANLLLIAAIVYLLPPAATAQVAQQKLADNQETPLRAPQATNIDGKNTEWGALQAYNKATQVSYTVANDDSTLYLVVQSTQAGITAKILRGGITFTVNTGGKKKDKDAASVTFPVVIKPAGIAASRVSVNSSGGAQVVRISSGSASGGSNGLSGAAAKKRSDSLAFVSNNARIQSSKDIKVKGIAAITDSLISIYNDEGIKARAAYEEQGVYTYELAIPFKYLGIDIKTPKEFLYHVMLNGQDINISLPAGAGISMVRINGSASSGSDFMSMMSPTDFWGKYTPAKK